MKAAPKKKKPTSPKAMNGHRKRPFQNFGLGKEKRYFIANLSMLIEAGMTVSDAVSSLAKETNSRAMRELLDDVAEDVQNGFPLSQALTNAGLLSDHGASLIRIGEQSGKLSQNLKIIATSEEKTRNFSSKMRSAMIYPIFIFGVTIAVGLVVVWFILPRLAAVFDQLDVALPGITKALISIGRFLGAHGVVVVPAAALVLGSILYFLFFFPRWKHVGQKILLYTPGIGKIIREIELAHMGYILGTLLQSGVPVLPALSSLSEATGSRAHKVFYLKLRDNLAEGKSFAKSFDSIKETSRFIPATMERLIVSGEQSGKLPETFLKINQHFEVKVDDTTKNLSVIFEPILLVIVWVGVVVVAMSVILPIYSLVGGLNK